MRAAVTNTTIFLFSKYVFWVVQQMPTRAFLEEIFRLYNMVMSLWHLKQGTLESLLWALESREHELSLCLPTSELPVPTIRDDPGLAPGR